MLIARASTRAIALAAWCVITVLTLGATAPAVDVEALRLYAIDMAADHAPQPSLAVRHVAPVRHRAIRHARTGSRQAPAFQSSAIVTARSNDWASRVRARYVHVPARHLLLNLIAPRAPASSLL